MSDQESYDLACWHQYEQDLQQQLEEMEKAQKELDAQTKKTDAAYLEFIRRAL